MASQDYTIELLLKANNQLSKELEKIEWQINKLDKQVNQTSSSVNTAFSKIWDVIKKWAIIGAITKIWKSIRDLTTAFEPIENSFYRLSETAWIVGEDMLQAMRKASMWTVSDLGLMEQANKAYSLWVVSSIDDMTTLMEIARVKGQAMWRTMEEALWDIVTWLWRSSPLILDNLWITIKLWEAQEQYAQQIWKTVDQLTEAEKKQALVNAVVEQWKKELAEAGEVSLTTQERFNQFTAQLQNLAVQIWQTFVPYVNFFFDSINEDISTNSSTIVSSIKRVVDKLWTWFAAVYTIISSLWTLLWWFFSGIRMEITNAFNRVVNGIRDWINKAIGWVNDKLGTSIWTIWEKFVLSSDEKKEWRIYSLWSAVEDVEAKWKKLADTIEESNKPITKTVNSTAKSLSGLSDALWWAWWGSKWSSKTSEAVKQIKERYEELTYAVDEQYKKIQEVNKEWQNWYKELEKNFEDVDKAVKNLKDDISDLKKSLSDLNKSETSDVASEFVNARRELQKMERDYEWIGEVAKQYSLDYLENFTHWWIGKYDIDALIQYKKYSDEMASVYDWLNASERKAMDEQIAYQDWYQSLNGIEKIKEDYRIKREEIQWELNEKMSALRQEELKRAEIEKQMAQYRKEWLETLNVEIKKRADMYLQKMDYEKKYMEQLEISHKREMQMYDELIRKLKEVARAKQEAWEWWSSWTRANWWPVYEWQQYLVWEHWPELFIPSQNWSIVKNEDLWKWQEFTINVNMWWVVVNDWQDTQQLAETIANTITRQLELYKKGIY